MKYPGHPALYDTEDDGGLEDPDFVAPEGEYPGWRIIATSLFLYSLPFLLSVYQDLRDLFKNGTK